MKKTILVTLRGDLKEKHLKRYKRVLKYNFVYVLTNNHNISEKKLSLYKNFKVIVYKDRKDIVKNIDSITKAEKDSIILPYFSGDSYSKYSIKILNKTYKTKIDPELFKQKDKMNSFLEKIIGHKKCIKYSYEEIQAKRYEEIEKTIGCCFILKPTNAASSLLNFKITNKTEFTKAKVRLKKKYHYVLEEYIEGNLYAVDLFCDGEQVYIICFTREIPFSELLEKFSPGYMNKYQNILREDFIHFLPIRYTLDMAKCTKPEVDFIKQVTKPLVEKNYKGFIHLEYKIKRKEKKIGFIEWGARLGGYRYNFIRKMFNVYPENILYELLVEKDKSQFGKRDGIFYLKNRDHERNFIGIKTNVLKETHMLSILEKTPNFLNESFETFLRNFLLSYRKIKIKEVEFFVKTTKDYKLYPFYERCDTQFSYIMELDEENFERFTKNKHAILEKLVFHDYSQE